MNLFNDYMVAVYSALNSTVGLTGIVTEKLDDVTSFPKIWIEDGGIDDWSNKSDNGVSATLNLHIGSRYNGTKEIRALMMLCHSVLHDADLTLSSGQCVLTQFVRSDIVIDSDGVTRHGVMRFNFLISEVV